MSETPPQPTTGTITPPCPFLAIVGQQWYCRHKHDHRQYPGNAPHVIYPGKTCASCMLVKLWPNAAMRDVPTVEELEAAAKPPVKPDVALGGSADVVASVETVKDTKPMTKYQATGGGGCKPCGKNKRAAEELRRKKQPQPPTR